MTEPTIEPRYARAEPSYASAEPEYASAEPARTVALIDLLDRVLAGGVVISGDITLSIEGVDLVHISLRTLVTSVSAALPEGPP